jgi:hypothetical protein
MTDVIEQASSARAKCRACGNTIAKGELRFGERLPNPFGEGEMTHWFHLACGAERHAEKVATAMAAYEGEIPDRDRIARIAAEGIKNPKLALVRRAEHSPSGRARCQECHEKIEKGELRVAFEREGETPPMAAQSYLHVRCAPAHLGGEGLFEKLRRLSEGLSDEDFGEIARTLEQRAE